LRQSSSLPRTLVVVPAAVTGPAQFQYLTDAIPASLTARLTGEGGLRMKMPPSSAEFAHIGANLERIGDTYRVSACVVPRGTVTCGRLVLAVQIVELPTRDLLWSREYQSSLERYGEILAEAAEGVRSVLIGGRRAIQKPTNAAESSALELAI